MVALGSSPVAQAAPVTSAAGTYAFEEVPEAEANRIAPITPEFWNQYAAVGSPRIQSFDVGTIIIGTIILDALVNIGKSVWNVIQAGRPKVNLDTDVASAVPQGISSWAELDSWKDPVAKLYRTQLLSVNQKSLGDVYYRLVFTYGGGYRGAGKYLTNVTIMPAQLSVPYLREFYAQTKVTELINHGTKDNPIAGMSLVLSWGIESVFNKTIQSISLHVRGDGKVDVLPTLSDVAQNVSAPARKVPPVIKIPIEILKEEPTPLDLAAD
jgi:hypothetical protein